MCWLVRGFERVSKEIWFPRNRIQPKIYLLEPNMWTRHLARAAPNIYNKFSFFFRWITTIRSATNRAYQNIFLTFCYSAKHKHIHTHPFIPHINMPSDPRLLWAKAHAISLKPIRLDRKFFYSILMDFFYSLLCLCVHHFRSGFFPLALARFLVHVCVRARALASILLVFDIL